MIGHSLSSNNEICYSTKIQTFSRTKHNLSSQSYKMFSRYFSPSRILTFQEKNTTCFDSFSFHMWLLQCIQIPLRGWGSQNLQKKDEVAKKNTLKRQTTIWLGESPTSTAMGRGGRTGTCRDSMGRQEPIRLSDEKIPVGYCTADSFGQRWLPPVRAVNLPRRMPRRHLCRMSAVQEPIGALWAVGEPTSTYFYNSFYAAFISEITY